MITAEQFLVRIEQIAAEEPKYLSGHDGSDGSCDCIGLIIGAIRRAGGQWRGLHGSNYAARKEVRQLRKIGGIQELRAGEAVFKSYEPGQGGYGLPARYERSGDYYDGDLRDYYHVGVVVSVNPLRIRHMTTPKPKLDKELGKWAWHGELRKIDYLGGGGDGSVKVTYHARVIGGALNLRTGPSKEDQRITQIPDGATVTVRTEGPEWSFVEYGNMSGYVMGRFLEEIPKTDTETGGGETVTVSRAQLMAVYDSLGDLLGLRG